MAYRLALVTGSLAIPILLGAQVAGPSLQLVSIRRVARSSELVLPRPSLSVLPGGRFEARNQTIENLVRLAFGFEDVDPRSGTIDRVRAGAFGSGLTSFDQFDITAVAEREWSVSPAPQKVPPELRTMLRTLLESRFKLKATLETKKISVTALRLIGVEPRRGLRRADNTCLGPFNRDPAAALATPSCPYRFDRQGIEAGSMTMPEVAALLAKVAGLVDNGLVDETGLPGRWNVTLDFPGAAAPRGMLVDASSGGDSRDGVRAADQAEELTSRAAKRDVLARQLGLTIVQSNVAAPVVRILHAERPAED